MGDGGLMGMHVPGMSGRGGRAAAAAVEDPPSAAPPGGVAIGAPRRSAPSLRLTGGLGEGWLPIFLAPSRMTAPVSELKAGAAAAGRTLADIAISPQVSIYVTDDVKAARHRERPHIAFYIGGMGVFYHQYMHRIGFGADADRIRQAWEARDRDGAARLGTDRKDAAMTLL